MLELDDDPQKLIDGARRFSVFLGPASSSESGDIFTMIRAGMLDGTTDVTKLALYLQRVYKLHYIIAPNPRWPTVTRMMNLSESGSSNQSSR